MLVKKDTLVGGFELFANHVIIPLSIDEKEKCKDCGNPTYQIQYLSKGRFGGTGIAISTDCPTCDKNEDFYKDFNTAVQSLDNKKCVVCNKEKVLIDNLCQDCHPYAPPEEYWQK